MRYAIYVITGPGGGYVGVTSRDPRRRWQEHIARGACKAIGAALKAHGTGAFTFRVLERVGTRNEAITAEVKWIRKLDTFAHGYNRTEGGDGVQGARYNLTLEQRANISRGLTGRRLAPAHAEASAARCRELAAKRRGIPVSEATRRKRSATLKALGHRPPVGSHTRENMARARLRRETAAQAGAYPHHTPKGQKDKNE